MWPIQYIITGYNWPFWASKLGPRNATMIAMMTTSGVILEVSGLVVLVLLVRRRWRKARSWAVGGAGLAALLFAIALFIVGENALGGGHS